MTYTWYYIFNKAAFEATELVSRTYTVNLESIGQREILVTKGNALSMLYEGVFLTLELNDKNPFEFDGHAAYIDENDNVWLGIAEAEDEN